MSLGESPRRWAIASGIIVQIGSATLTLPSGEQSSAQVGFDGIFELTSRSVRPLSDSAAIGASLPFN
jgi:hypothetical protein